MEVNEIHPVSRGPRAESVDYQEPAPEDLKRIPRKALLDGRATVGEGYRIKLIDAVEIVLEPRQEGVTAYPPVQVTDHDPNRLTP